MFRPETSPTTTKPASKTRTTSVLEDGLPLPKLFVFDLDYTLWPLWVDCHVSGPLKPLGSDGLLVRDRSGSDFGLFPDVAGLLVQIRDAGCTIAAASKTPTPDRAREMLRFLKVGGKPMKDWFDVLEIYPNDKRVHFKKIREKTGLEYEEMVFFDDESVNRNVETLGVTMRLVRDGVTVDEVEKGVKEWRKRNGRMKE
ncbi:magnesium-dependent phosphatase-1 [Myriangium duriaei CBS 260.36]|uniref:Magnesium-dependent phosphatase-1 n=1 Tax=Myriangium duriaei CBS 260.36 TaxID=1168546 RepID=A0A9P4J645_9PEZI|nr:magnesium-dependent phosphatase-1 [Myriangium duriaei CBS 260.36]